MKMNIKELAEDMLSFQYELGESILDGRFATNINERHFMEWCYETGKIDENQLGLFIEDHDMNEMEASEMSDLLLITDDREYMPYTVLYCDTDAGEVFNERYRDAFEVFAEYVLSRPEGLNRWLAYKTEDE